MKKYEIAIEGMSCMHCAARVEKKLSAMGDNLQVEIGKAVICSKSTPEQLREAIEELGFDVTSVIER